MSCVSCNSNFCSCGTSTIAIPVVKGDKGDTGATGATGAQGPMGMGALNAVKKYVQRFTYDGTVLTTTITRVTLEDNALLSQYAYSVQDAGIINTIFGVGCHVLNLKLYAQPNSAVDEFYDITRWMEPIDVRYTTSDIRITWTTLAGRVYSGLNIASGQPLDFWIVIIG